MCVDVAFDPLLKGLYHSERLFDGSEDFASLFVKKNPFRIPYSSDPSLPDFHYCHGLSLNEGKEFEAVRSGFFVCHLHASCK